MAINVAINGFGRIGRLVARIALKRPEINLVAVNDIGSADSMAYLFKYDSVHGRFDGDVKEKVYDKPDADGAVGELNLGGKIVKITAAKDPATLPHKKYGIDVVVESTGRFTDCTKDPSARSHLKAGARKVIISAPAKGMDATVAVGVNDEVLKKEHTVVSNASCTTNCLAPVVKVLHAKYGIKRGLMTTIHSYTNDQRVLDLAHDDLRRSRAAAINQIPSKTGAAAAIGEVLPELKGLLDGYAVRVPTPNVSCVDLVVETEKAAKDVKEINELFKAVSAKGDALSKVLRYTDEPLVSTDFIGDPASSTFDATCTRIIGGNFIKILAWYDNEWGYSNRVVDLIPMFAAL